MGNTTFTPTSTTATLTAWFNGLATVTLTGSPPFLGTLSPILFYLEYSFDDVNWLPTDSYSRVSSMGNAQLTATFGTNGTVYQGTTFTLQAVNKIVATGLTIGQTVFVRARLQAENGQGTIQLDGLNPGFIIIEN